MEYLIAFLIGIISSITGALLGIGGGIIIVPSLSIILKIPIHNAIAISLSTIVATSILVSAQNLKNGLINLDMAIKLEFVTAFFAITASFLAISIPQQTLKAVFGIFLIFIAFFMHNKKRADIPENLSNASYSYIDPKDKKQVYYDIKNPKAAIVISSLAGFLSGLLGVGGGVIKVPILNGVCKIPMKAASATSSLMVGITASAASLIYFRHGYVLPDFVFFTSMGALLGSRIGLYVSKKSKNETLEIIFVVVLLIVAIEMIVRSIL